MKLWQCLLLVAVAIAAIALLAFALRRYLSRLVDQRIGDYQSDLLNKQVAEVENMYRQTRGWRHDLRNHIQAMQAYLQLGQLDELARYLQGLGDDLATVDTVLKTGNVMADAILNSKLSLARTRGVQVHAKAMIPPACGIPDMDLCVIIGNLLDNAVEACARVPEGKPRFIRVYIGRLKQQLYISVSNAAADLHRENGRLLSSKPGRDAAARHGFGLMRIDKIAKRCGGYVNRQSETGVFATEVFLPLQE